MKRNISNAMIVLLLIAAVAGIWSFDNGAGNMLASTPDIVRESAKSALLPHPAFAQVPGNVSIADVVEKSIDSVVNISSTKIVRMPENGKGSPFFDDPLFRRFFGPDNRNQVPKEQQEQRQQSLGSGVIVSADGTILTNNHVVEDTDELKVRLNDDREFDAEIVGTDPQTDLAVIRLKGDNVKNLKPIKFGDSERLRLGDTVLAIGNPFGLSHTVTMGIVSAKGRSFSPRQRITEYENFIQTDAAINPGNSGGALINLQGELVGINTAIVSRSGGYQGIGFAIPSNMSGAIMDGLVKDGRIVRGWLGVYIQDVSPDMADAMGLKSSQGALISDVTDDSPAKKAGIQSGDIIVKVNDEAIDSSNHLRNTIAMLGADKTVKVTVIRDGKERDLRVKLAERTGEVVLASAPGSQEKKVEGLTVAPLNASAREQYSIPDDVKNGIVVTKIETGSRAEDAGLRPGDVIIEVNKTEVKSVSSFRTTYNDAKNNLLLYVYRGGNKFFAVLKK